MGSTKGVSAAGGSASDHLNLVCCASLAQRDVIMEEGSPSRPGRLDHLPDRLRCMLHDALYAGVGGTGNA